LPDGFYQNCLRQTFVITLLNMGKYSPVFSRQKMLTWWLNINFALFILTSLKSPERFALTFRLSDIYIKKGFGKIPEALYLQSL